MSEFESLIERKVKEVRKILAQKYDVRALEPGHIIESPNQRPLYSGTCDEAHSLLATIMCEDGFIVDIHHGEQTRAIWNEPKNWFFEHTWSSIIDPTNGKRWYIDCTSSQWQPFYNIPDYYISYKAPKWYLDDDRNIRFIRFFGKNIINNDRLDRIWMKFEGVLCRKIIEVLRRIIYRRNGI